MSDNRFSTDSAPKRRLEIAGRSFGSRLMVGTGKYRSPEIMSACHCESGAEIITVAVRRVNLGDNGFMSRPRRSPWNSMATWPSGGRWREVSITPGATLEIFRFVGGG
jgi:hypothetical protein